MLNNIFVTIVNMIIGQFAIIPQYFYFIYATATSFLDMLQFVVRKLIGLDVYYIYNASGTPVEQSGDVLTRIIESMLGINNDYSVLSSVFWSMVIFGVVLLVFATIISIIKSHYSYDGEKSQPTYIIGKAVRGLLTMVIIPITTIFGIYLSQVLVKTLDIITRGNTEMILADTYETETISKFKSATVNGQKTYSSFDIFGKAYWTDSYMFSSALFQTAVYSCNRVRTGGFTAVTGETNNYWDNAGVFWTTNEAETKETLAKQIDTAFQYNLRLSSNESIDFNGEDTEGLVYSYSNPQSAVFMFDLINASGFSKYKTGLVFYYYDLWAFNLIIGYGGVITAVTLLLNIILGLIKRLIYLTAVFLAYPVITALFPFDEGKAVKSWRSSFMKLYLASYGTVVSINLLGIILPFLHTITFFNIGFLDAIINAIFIIVGLTVIKKIIALISGLIGADNLEDVGAKIVQQYKDAVMKGIARTLGMANVGVKAGKSIANTTKTRFVKSKVGKKPWQKLTKDDKEKYKKMREEAKRAKKDRLNEQRKKQHNEKLQELAKRKLDEDKSSVKDPRKSNYATRAKQELAKTNPELYKAGRKSGRSKASKERYKKALIELEQKYAMEDAIKELGAEPEPIAERKPFSEKVSKLLYDEKKVESKDEQTGEKKVETKKVLKQPLQDFVDAGQMTFKLMGDLAGIDGITEAIKKSGVKDEFDRTVKNFAQALNIPTKIKTKEEKEQEEEEKAEKKLNDMKSFVETQEKTTAQIEVLKTRFESLYKAVQERDEEQEKAKNKKSRSTNPSSAKKSQTQTDKNSGNSQQYDADKTKVARELAEGEALQKEHKKNKKKPNDSNK